MSKIKGVDGSYSVIEGMSTLELHFRVAVVDNVEGFITKAINRYGISNISRETLLWSLRKSLQEGFFNISRILVESGLNFDDEIVSNIVYDYCGKTTYNMSREEFLETLKVIEIHGV